MDSEVAAGAPLWFVALRCSSLVITNAFYRCPSSAGQSTNTYVHHWTCGMGNCGPAQSAVGHVEL